MSPVERMRQGSDQSFRDAEREPRIGIEGNDVLDSRKALELDFIFQISRLGAVAQQ